MNYLPIIGLEIHVEPATKSKMFCSCPADHFGKPPNTQTCPVCLGLPGALPVPNQTAINACIKLGLALNCKINLSSKFDRKNYFYPDLPKSYQISQYDQPFCYEGNFDYRPQIPTSLPKRGNKEKFNNETIKQSNNGSIKITRVHMEEDTGKLQHVSSPPLTKGGLGGVSLIDFNRSGVPLIEIVTEPDIHSADEMTVFLKELVRLIRWLDISDCDMEKGSLRLEANVSVARIPPPAKGGQGGVTLKNTNNSTTLPHDHTTKLPKYKVELKNINSFRFLEKAVLYEIDRQIKILKKSQIPKQETRGFVENKGITFSQRSKEAAQDYRYYPEPDIPPIKLTKAQILKLKSQIIDTPLHATGALITKYQIRPDYASILTQTRKTYTNFLSLLPLPTPLTPPEAAKQIINQKINILKEKPADIIKLIAGTQRQYTITELELKEIIHVVLHENYDAVKDYNEGKPQAIGFLIGQVAKATRGQADPKLTQELLKAKLS